MDWDDSRWLAIYKIFSTNPPPIQERIVGNLQSLEQDHVQVLLLMLYAVDQLSTRAFRRKELVWLDMATSAIKRLHSEPASPTLSPSAARTRKCLWWSGFVTEQSFHFRRYMEILGSAPAVSAAAQRPRLDPHGAEPLYIQDLDLLAAGVHDGNFAGHWRRMQRASCFVQRKRLCESLARLVLQHSRSRHRRHRTHPTSTSMSLEPGPDQTCSVQQSVRSRSAPHARREPNAYFATVHFVTERFQRNMKDMGDSGWHRSLMEAAEAGDSVLAALRISVHALYHRILLTLCRRGMPIQTPAPTEDNGLSRSGADSETAAARITSCQSLYAERAAISLRQLLLMAKATCSITVRRPGQDRAIITKDGALLYMETTMLRGLVVCADTVASCGGQSVARCLRTDLGRLRSETRSLLQNSLDLSERFWSGTAIAVVIDVENAGLAVENYRATGEEVCTHNDDNDGVPELLADTADVATPRSDMLTSNPRELFRLQDPDSTLEQKLLGSFEDMWNYDMLLDGSMGGHFADGSHDSVIRV
ncbi:hypothetical protein Micbo1qcDRAFT_180867 [Microdochium bolleyi]|uniref:Transcription factor domain-containing protein n=1 Tax=Microdochium bolleyi TaxID=196109 RepID=A0A136IK66_9PEZI|nr:hypothetical protein Micbo1qcDRAFT_180867 [Microdochium bolleyi]